MGKGNKQTFHGLLDAGSELTLIPGDPKKHCDPPVKVRAYGGQAIDGVLVSLSHSGSSGSSGSPTHPVFISPVLECKMGQMHLEVGRILTLVP